MGEEQQQELLFQPAKSYKFLSNGNLPVAGINDAQEFRDTTEAMNIMGMSEEEQMGKGGRRVESPLFAV